MRNIARLIAAGVVGGGGGVSAPSPLIVADSFTAANSTNLNGRMPDVINTPGAAWAVGAGGYQIQSNAAWPSSYASSIARVTYDTGVADANLKLTYRTGQTTAVSEFVQILFRFVDTQNFWCLTFGKLSSAGLWKIQEVVSNSATDRATGTYTYAANTNYVLDLTFNGASVSALRDGANSISYNSASTFLTATIVGVLIFQLETITNRPTFDDFQVYTL